MESQTSEMAVSCPYPNQEGSDVRLAHRASTGAYRGTLQEVADEYLAYRAAAYAANTVRGDRQALDKLIRHTNNSRVTDVTPTVMDGLLTHLRSTGMQASTIKLTLDKLSAFFNWCRERGHIPHNQSPIGSRRNIKVPAKDKLIIPRTEFPRIIEAAGNERDRFLVITGLYTMLRQGEVAALKVGDLDLERGKLSAEIFKSYTSDELPIAPDYRQHIVRWLAHYQKECGPLQPHWYLIPAMRADGFQTFTLNPEAPISRSYDIIRRTFQRAGIEGEWLGMHVLRRSAANAILQARMADGYDGAMRLVQTFLHHASITTTEKYLSLDVDKATRDGYYLDNAMFGNLEVDNGITDHPPLRLVQ